MNRAAGILLPISSLPSEYGIGCFSRAALTERPEHSGRRISVCATASKCTM